MIDLTQNSVTFTLIKDYEPIPDVRFKGRELRKTDYYEELLARSLIGRANVRDASITVENQTKIFPYIKYIIEWVRSGDFYTSPASIKYHDAHYSGLLTHTLEAYNQLVSLRGVDKFREVVDNQWWSAVFAVLVHDWCKIGKYDTYYKNVKQDNGEWTQQLAYKYKDDGVMRLGHGTQSLVMAMQLCNSKYTSLTFEEMAAIRWHMDNWDMSQVYDSNDLSRCNERIPMVRMVQFADQLSITEY